ncbi:MAG TPA: hypothetical protein VFM11_06000 [Burkholderiales bacterium]|nr:hypothetical protein [Burkholderiales bacterium]
MVDTDFQSTLNDLAMALRRLHRALVDLNCKQYEHEYGPVPGPGDLLHLLANDPYFAWLHPLSELIVDLDVLLEADEPATEVEAAAVRREVEEFISAPAAGAASHQFARRYLPLIAEDPHVAIAHAEVKRNLQRLPSPAAVTDAEILHEKHRWALAKRHRT